MRSAWTESIAACARKRRGSLDPTLSQLEKSEQAPAILDAITQRDLFMGVVAEPMPIENPLCQEV